MSSGKRRDARTEWQRFGRVFAVAITLLVVASVVVAPVAGTVTLDGDATATGPAAQYTISSCPKSPITNPGVYTVTSDLTNATKDDCIDVEASDVVIDGNGHTVTGTGKMDRGGTAIFVSSFSKNVTVKNVRFRHWGRAIWARNADDVTVADIRINRGYRGIEFFNVNDSRITNVTITRYARGVVFWGVTNTTVARSTMSLNVHGVIVAAHRKPDHLSSDVRVVNNTINDNSFFGVLVMSRSNHTVIADNTLVGNEDQGINVTNGSDYTVIRNNTVADTTNRTNSSFGGPNAIGVSDSKHVEIIDNTVTNTNGTGINVTDTRHLTQNTKNVTVANNTVRNSERNGIHVADSDRIVVRDNTVTGNRLNGIVSEDVPAVEIYDNDVSGHADRPGVVAGRGLLMRGVYRNAGVFGNDFHDNWIGVEVANGSNGLSIFANDIEKNAHAGVRLGKGAPTRNIQIHNNSLADNGDYGVLNHESNKVVNATGNWWGDSSGPSSNSSDADAPFDDPNSGGVADGNGSAVSEGATAGVSNVDFDPYEKSSSGSSPGFTPAVALAALLAFALLTAGRES